MTSPTPQSYMPGAQPPSGPAQPAPKKSRRPLIVAAVVALVVVIGGAVGLTVALPGDDDTTPASQAALPAAQALKPPVIHTPADVATEVRQRSGLECARLTPVPDPVGAVARSSCSAGRGEIVISTYANSADVAAQWKTYSETITAIGDAAMAMGDNWTVSGDDDGYMRKAAEVLGGSYSTAAKAEPTAPAVGTPVAKDFKLSVKILRKKCFGSAGCNIDYRIEMTYAGDPLALAAGRSYEITYQVKGAEEEVIGTFEVTGDSYSTTEESTQTTSSAKKLTAVATGVTEM